MSTRLALRGVLSCAVLGLFSSITGFAEQIPLTILHTNDVHSHFRGTKGEYKLGGVARIATTLRRVRDEVPNTLTLDGGDWSEGHIYYNLDAGRTALEMMTLLGYDAAALGNHDWLNGPDQLLKIFNQVKPTTAILSANIDMSKYSKADELSKYLLPYKIFTIAGVKIAVIGLSTYELIYDKFFAPVQIKDPFGVTRKLAADLKKQADLVVVVSHNGMSTSKLIAGMPNVDLVIHAHDHAKLFKPLEITRNGKTTLMVEAHHWGFYVGRLDLVFDTDSKQLKMKNYDLIQMDDSIPEDLTVLSKIASYERQLESRYGDIFADKIAEATLDLRKDSNEPFYGNLLTDAYRDYVGADISFEQVALASGEMYKGWLSTSDIYNALTVIFNPNTGKAWTLKTMKMTGATLQWILNLVMSIGSYVPGGLVSVSGAHIVYDPMSSKSIDISGEKANQPLKSLEIGGKPVDLKKKYLVALPHGIYEALDFIENSLGNKIERFEEKDTGIEDWRVLAAYLKKNSPITPATAKRGNRVQVLQSDLGVYYSDALLTRDGSHIEGEMEVKNYGATASNRRVLSVTFDMTPKYIGDDPNPAQPSMSWEIPSLQPGESQLIKVSFNIPAKFNGLLVPLYFVLDHSDDDPNKTNDACTVNVDDEGRKSEHPPVNFKAHKASDVFYTHEEHDGE